MCADGFAQPAVLASLEGRFLYASTLTSGRVAVMAVKCLTRHLASGGILKLDNEDCTLLQRTIELLEDMSTHEIRAGTGGVPVLISTDGAHEGDGCMATHGAVLIDPASGLRPPFFGKEILQASSTRGVHLAGGSWWARLRCCRCWLPNWRGLSTRSIARCCGSVTMTLPKQR